jgi:hypothetical protein
MGHRHNRKNSLTICLLNVKLFSFCLRKLENFIYKFFVLSNISSKYTYRGERGSFLKFPSPQKKDVYMCKYQRKIQKNPIRTNRAGEKRHVKFIIRKTSSFGTGKYTTQQIGCDLVKNLRKEMLIFSLANITREKTKNRQT